MLESSKRYGFMFSFVLIAGLVSQMGCQTKYEGIGPASSNTPAMAAVTFNDLGPSIGDITSNLEDYPNGQVPRYGKFELTFDIDGTFQNPYNPAEITVDAYFTSPGGDVLVQPGFYYQDYELNSEADSETLVPVGDPVWKVRFSPMETGLYQYYIQAAEGTAGTKTPQSTFEVSASDDPGFIRISPVNSRYFEFQNGDPFLGIGLNVAWWQQPETGISTYKTYFDRMGEYRANLARVWMTNSGMTRAGSYPSRIKRSVLTTT